MFPTCCIADFQSAERCRDRGAASVGASAGWKHCDTAGWKPALRGRVASWMIDTLRKSPLLRIMQPEEPNPNLDRVRYELRATGVKPDGPNPLRSGVHSRGYLPHVKREGAAYFVTFRL